MMTPAQMRLRCAWNQLSPQEQIQALKTAPWVASDWLLQARDNQLAPDGIWTDWLILAGRGFGKTRTGAETVRQWVKMGHRYCNLIGATADDARDIMVDGESGILAICPKGERPDYKKSERKLVWQNGAQSLIFTADEPERLRGKQHEKLWADEVASWRYEDSWAQAQFGLRLGKNPQSVITTTPKPKKLIKELLKASTTHITRGSTYDNRANLAPQFFNAVIKKYEGTRLGRQELNAEVLDDVEGALWTRTMIDGAAYRGGIPDMQRVIVAIDPAVSSGEESDETGIVVAGLGVDGYGYVLADLTCKLSPDGWARRAINAYKEHRADLIVAEVNNGGELVRSVIQTIDSRAAYKPVHASRGKVTRAEPISALYEQGRIRHTKDLEMLEDQLCNYSPNYSDKSPDRMDALVWALTELMLGEQSVSPATGGSRTF